MTDPQPLSGPAAAAARASRALTILRQSYLDRFAEPVFDVEATAGSDGAVHLTGQVLVERQWRQALAIAVDLVAGECPVTDRIVVLTAVESAEAWVEPGSGLVDVLDAPSGRRETQVVSGDPPMRVLVRRGDWYAIEAADGTVGWSLVAQCRTLEAREPRGIDEWRSDWLGKARSADADDWRSAAEPWLGAPYLWGGTTMAGIDCSGLTQRLFRSVLGVGLPRHSLDQMRRGRRVESSGVAAGDLLALTQTGSGMSHVAVIVNTRPDLVAHACRQIGHVVIEPKETMLAKYRYRAARRFTPESPE